jgi:phosphosulfolactate phosphohydrolase-like enzyme
VNLSVAVARARQVLAETDDLLVLCAGREGEFGLDDAYTAGRLILGVLDGHKPRQGANDSALVCIDLARRYSTWLRPLLAARAGRELVRLGFRDDVVLAATQDRYPLLPQFSERRITVRAA